EIAPKEYVRELKEADGEQQPATSLPEEDALQQRIFNYEYDYDNNRPPQYQQSAPAQQRYVDDFSDIASLKEEEREIVNQNRYINKYGAIPQLIEYQKQQMEQYKLNYQMGEQLQAANDEVINGLKYLVGSTGWGKQPMNAYFNRQNHPNRIFQWYTNEGQTILRQAKVKLSKQQLLNMPAKRKNYIKTSELEKSLKAPKQLRKK
ncbi:MAG: hypothetical protein EZS28_032217, partial [Streblomastix strix]